MVKALPYQNPLLKPLSSLMLPNIPGAQPSPVVPRSTLQPIRPLTPIAPTPAQAGQSIPYPMRVPGTPYATPNFAPLKPLVQQPESPVVSAAKGFYGGVNDAGGLVSTLIGSVLPFGEANLYSESGRANVLQALQDSTYDPDTNQWFKAGSDAVQKVEDDRGDFGKEAGNLTSSLLNALSFVPIGAGANAAKSVGTVAVKDAVKDLAKSSVVGGAYSGASGTASALQDGANLPEALGAGLENVPAGLLLGAALPAAAKGLKIGGGKVVKSLKEAQAGPNSEAGFAKIPGPKPVTDASTPTVDTPVVSKTKPDTIRAFGKTIDMTPENGYQVTKTPDGGVVYKKSALSGSNIKGDKSATTNYYSSDGTKLTQAQHDAYVKGDISTIAKTSKSIKTTTNVSEIGSPKSVPTTVKTSKNPLVPKSKGVLQEVPILENIGTAKTGEKGKSAAKISKGRTYEKTSNAASKGRGAIEADKTTYGKFIKSVDEKSVPTTKQADTARALQEKFTPGSSEHKALGKIAGRNVTEAAQTLGTIDRVTRKKATAKQITTKFANHLYTILDDDRTVNKSTFKAVEEKNRAFEVARKTKDTAYNKFQADPSEVNARAYQRAHQNFTKADTESLFEEYNTVAKAIKDGGTKNTDAKKYLETLRKNSGIYFMDYVDSNLLSSTRVMLNNYINTATVAGEEAMFGKAGAALARKLVPGAQVGGGSIRGQIMGAKIGAKETITEAKLRQSAHQNGPLKTLSNFTTTGNTIGDHNITGVAYSAAYDSYRAELKAKGYKGAELERRAKVETLSDKDGRVGEAKKQALAAVGLGPIFGGDTTKLESKLTGLISGVLGDSAVAKTAAKVITRVGIGFPTVTLRGAYGGVKRSTLGFISAGQAVKNAVTKGDPNITAMHIKNAVKEAGSGATMMGIGAALASTGNLSGAYPDDKDERAAWAREGKMEYSIKLGGNWYNLPQALGVFALPFMIGANAQENVANGKAPTDDILNTTWTTIKNLSPNDQIQATLDLISGTTEGKYAQAGSSVVKALTPLGSLVNQLAKAFDPTANDTTQGDVLTQFVSKVRDGVPGLNVGLPDKEVEGKAITNPDPLARMLGAVSHEQEGGVQTTKDIKATVVAANKQLADNGVFSDDIRNLMPDDKTKALFDDIKSGKNTDPSDSKTILDAATKNVTASEDTRFLEDGNYDANLAVLKAKRDLVAADPTSREASIKAYDEQIARGQVYKDNKTPYELTQDYSKTSVSEWRAMGDPDSDEYNPDMYQALWDLDSKLAAAGGSRNTDDPSTNKFSAKKSGSGSGGSASGKANAKAAGNAIIAAAKGAPVAKLPDAPKVTQATYRKVPVTFSGKSGGNRFAPITISARSRQSKKA